ncbi:helix-turn-helix transcriptional regulator [Aliirhizobium cellulosilyticum]|uniref:Putative DNA-binding transcriptional regulator AlpA n=1 Tax=Aliirhizobium cellulosilyticum TaxID=393664 RepID=A0A7W6XBC6_9HYPH|nr:AlpA family phage regulatory protein [Rhizobium cellulosilyticum]MBB4348733.1 putative DNA-binding transcriptional regulator AlpA [Rhizobium cellulosilyticum]MBB4411969.1 putative DNA-binding transcriptional regulator AlpA [Rhizobium cellulosilyticum]MBB4449431.1 putative DNA-binding transcriptional regulator AlpA [Rhizobium cellulosilyticum]
MKCVPPRRATSLDELSHNNSYAAMKAGLGDDTENISDHAEPQHANTRSTKRISTGSSPDNANIHVPNKVSASASFGPYLSDKEVAQRYGVKKQTIWRWAKKSETFPKPIKFQGTTTRWCLAALMEYERREKEDHA